LKAVVRINRVKAKRKVKKEKKSQKIEIFEGNFENRGGWW